MRTISVVVLLSMCCWLHGAATNAQPSAAADARAMNAPSPVAAPAAPAAPTKPSALAAFPDLVTVSTSASVPLAGLAEGSAAAAKAQAEYARNVGLPVEVRTKKSAIALRLIPAGTFMMGSPDAEPNHKDSEPLHRVTLTRPYYIGVNEITEREWKRVMGSPHGGLGVDETLPVEAVAYADAVAFLKKLCALEGVPEETYTLPSEAQWECACRAGTTAPYYFGDTLTPQQALFGKAKDGVNSRAAVRLYPPNAFGLYDMHGNVAEWCRDWWEQTYQRIAVVDPTGAQPGEFRIVRGGAWDKPVTMCRSAERWNLPPSYAWETVGFRIVRILPPQTK